MWHNARDCMLAERMVEDIDIVFRRVEHFGLTCAKFCDDHSFEGEIAYDAVMNPVYRVVEDACHLSEEFTGLHPEIAWREMRGFRNFVAHGYGAINRRMAWEVIENNLAELRRLLEEVLA